LMGCGGGEVRGGDGRRGGAEAELLQDVEIEGANGSVEEEAPRVGGGKWGKVRGGEGGAARSGSMVANIVNGSLFTCPLKRSVGQEWARLIRQ